MKNTIVVDFDRTLIFVNSFPIYFIFVLLCALVNFSKDFFKVISLLMKRILNFDYDHVSAKQCLMDTSKNGSIFITCAILRPFLRKKLVTELREAFLSGSNVVVSTGADERLVRYFCGKFLDFEVEVQGSHSVDFNFWNNIGENKKLYLKRRNFCKIKAVYTDHFSDFCLLDITEKFYLVRPDPITFQHYQEHIHRDKICVWA